jgi:hypothetical protein
LVGAGELELMVAVETATELLSQPSRWSPFFHSITNHKGKQMAVNRGAWRDVEGMRGGGDGTGRRGGAQGGAHGTGTRGGLVTAKRTAAAPPKVKHQDKKSLGARAAGGGRRGREKNGEHLVRAGMVLRLVSSSPSAPSCVASSLLLRSCVRCAWCSSSLLLRFLLSPLALARFSLSLFLSLSLSRTYTHTSHKRWIAC